MDLARALRCVVFSVLDVETTGLSPVKHEIIEIGLVRVEDFSIVNEYRTLVKPAGSVDPRITELTGINHDMLMIAPEKEEIGPHVSSFIGDTVLVEHSCNRFDVRFLEKLLGRKVRNRFLNTLLLSRRLHPEEKHHDLASVCYRLGLTIGKHHQALDDARATADLLIALLQKATRYVQIRDLQCITSLFEGRGAHKG